MLIAVFVLATAHTRAQYSELDLRREAGELFDQGKYAKAMPLYARLLSLKPTDVDLNFRYGATALYGDADKKKEAVKFLRFATSKPGADDLSWYFLGRAYHLNYQFADAVKAYTTYTTKANKKDVEARGVDRAIEDCRNGLALLSNIKEVVVLDKKQRAGRCFFQKL